MKAAGFEMVHERDMALDSNQVRFNLYILKYTRWYTTLGRFFEEPSSLLVRPHHN